jgi:hypothetical protein
MLEVYIFSKNKIFHGNLPEAGRFRELDHRQYELERFNQCIIMGLGHFTENYLTENHFTEMVI